MDSTAGRARDAGTLARLHARRARRSDVTGMVKLLGHLFEQEQDFVPAPGKQRAALDLILSRPSTGRLFVLARGNEVLGMVSLLFTVSTAEGGRAAWIEDMVVRPDCRGKGLGRQLLQAAVAWAAGHGLTRLSLLTDASNARAKAFYQRQGFVVSAMQPLRLHLPRPRAARAHAVHP